MYWDSGAVEKWKALTEVSVADERSKRTLPRSLPLVSLTLVFLDRGLMGDCRTNPHRRAGGRRTQSLHALRARSHRT